MKPHCIVVMFLIVCLCQVGCKKQAARLSDEAAVQDTLSIKSPGIPGFRYDLLAEIKIHQKLIRESRRRNSLEPIANYIAKQEVRPEAEYEVLLKLAEQMGDAEVLMTELFCTGVKLRTLANKSHVLDLYFRGLKIAEQRNDKFFAGAFTGRIANVYYITGKLQESLEMQFKSLKIFEEIKSDAEIAGVLLDIGTVYRELKDTVNTVKYYIACKKYVNGLGRNSYTVEVYNSIGAAYEMSGQPDAAMPYYKKAFAIADSLGIRSSQASTLALMADNCLIKGDLKSAEGYALQAISIAENMHLATHVFGPAYTLNRIYRQTKNYEKALQYFDIYTRTRDSATSEQNKMAVIERQFAYDVEKKDQENRLLAQKNQIQALELSRNKDLIIEIFAGLILISGIVYLLYRQGKLRSQQQQMQLEQKLLRSQMNPHFIFNSLQAIQNFILKQEGKEAVKYLSSFAFLTRSVLENSQMEYISLKKEAVLLETYLALQKLRFRNTFNYSIRIDEALHPDEIYIPPMLAQPFIENAVEHGMSDIANDGQIDVYFGVRDNGLCIEITDNGLGFDHAGRHNNSHKSLAMDITRKRIELMDKKTGKHTVFKIGDAFPDHPTRKGVKITIILPMSLS